MYRSEDGMWSIYFVRLTQKEPPYSRVLDLNTIVHAI